MSAEHAQPGVNMLCLNVRGLTSEKLVTLLSWLRDQRTDIAVLTETHVTTDPADMLLRQPGAGVIWPRVQLFHCPGSGRTGGVCIVVGPSCYAAAPSQFTALNGGGRVLRLDLTIRSVALSIVGVYGPAQPQDRAAFYRDTLPPFLPADGRPLLVAGDFNCVVSEVDCFYPPGQPPPAQNSRLAGSPELLALMSSYQLRDVWREASPGQRTFTHFSSAGNSGARLDRWLVSTPLLQLFSVRSTILPAPGDNTDHLPVSLHLERSSGRIPLGKGLRGFPLLLLNMGDAANALQAFLFVRCQELLSAPLADLLRLYDQFKVDVMREAWRLYQQHRRQREQRARQAQREAADALHLLTHCSSMAAFPACLQRWRDAVAAATTAWQQLAARPRQIVDVLDHMFGDSSTYYFHAQARAPHPPSLITTLNRPGRAPDAPPDTADLTTRDGCSVGLQYAASFYSSASPFGLFRPRADISPADQDSLLATLPTRLPPAHAALAEGVDGDGLLTEEELDLALHMATRGSSPGYDGLPYEFYRAFRGVMLPVLLKVFNHAFQSAESVQPLAPLLRGVICLIPKKGQPASELSSYRPITLLNCDAKLVMLVVANRLQRPLDYVVDIVQSAFLRGRDISDNIRYHVGLATRLQELGLPGWLLHSDLTKAYDTADRGWLSRCMTAMGFKAAGIVRWCRILMAGSSAMVRVNGFLSNSFPVSNGLPQGSALSCMEWVLLLQPAVAYLNHLRSVGRLAGLQLPDGRSAPATLAFADDTKSYVQRPEVDGPEIKAAFQLFARAGLPVQSVPKTKLIHLHGDIPPPLLPSAANSHHAATGYCLQPLEQPHRLLGVPFGPALQTCTKAAFDGMAPAMRAVAASWHDRKLTLLGRSHVAMQCVASKFVYQANFSAPTPPQLAAMQQAVNRFVGSSSRLEEEAPLQTYLYPRFSVSALPHHQGGTNVPDLAAFSSALLAKPGWLLFRHTAHPWQSLMRHEVARACQPRLGRPAGYYRLVTDPASVAADSIRTPLVHSMVHAFCRLKVSRIVDPATQDFESILLELTFNNAAPGLQPVAPAEVPVSAQQWYRLRNVRSAYLDAQRLAPAEQAALQLILQRLPEPWRAAVTMPQPPSAVWCVVSPTAAPALLLTGPHPTTGAQRLWELWPSGRLHCLPVDTPVPAGPARPALVELRAKPREAWLREDYDLAAARRNLPAAERQEVEEPWLVGVWEHMELDPRVWGITVGADTQVSLLRLTVRHARRLLAHRLALARSTTTVGHIPGYAQHGAVWPALWAVHGPDPDPAELPVTATEDLHWLGVAGLEERWRRAAAASDPEEAAPEDSLPINTPPRWLDLNAQRSPRPSPEERAEARDHHPPPPDPPLRPGFAAVWTRLRDPTIHRPFRITCWRLLHGQLGCRAFLAHARRLARRAVEVDACCQAPGCLEGGATETLTHALLDCPSVAPVISWLCNTWAHLTQQPPPPRLASLLLADDTASWPNAPQDAGAMRLWTRLRVTTLGAIWRARCAREEGMLRPGSFARQVVAAVVGHINAAIRRDWARTQVDLRQLDDGAFCVDWWRGFDTALTVEQFELQWAVPPLLCEVAGPGPAAGAATRSLHLRLGTDSPIPWPDAPPQPPLLPPSAPLPAGPPAPAPSPPSPSASDSDSQPDCPICKRHFTVARPAITTACAHTFHAHCLAQWLDRRQTCPLCRRAI